MSEDAVDYIAISASSNVRIAEYFNDESRLRVGFVSGTIYDYADVPEEVWNDMVATFSRQESVGQFFNANIRGKYVATKLPKDEEETE